MSKVALADAQKEWAEILDGLDTVAGLDKPDLREMREELAAMVAAVRELRADQAALEARRQSITQQLRITRRRAQDLVIQIKAAVKGSLGHRSELLVRFGIRPKRTRKTREELGIFYYPRPDLLAAAGLAQDFQAQVPPEEN
jgi:chromosome segregation ATPase